MVGWLAGLLVKVSWLDSLLVGWRDSVCWPAGWFVCFVLGYVCRDTLTGQRCGCSHGLVILCCWSVNWLVDQCIWLCFIEVVVVCVWSLII